MRETNDLRRPKRENMGRGGKDDSPNWEKAGSAGRRSGKRWFQPASGGFDGVADISASSLNPQPTTHNTIYQRANAPFLTGKPPNRKCLPTSHASTSSHPSPTS